MYEATWDSVATHPLPDWYDDAKLGILLHMGRRDIVGDLRHAVLDAGMRMGLYYSGGYDWPYNRRLLDLPTREFGIRGIDCTDVKHVRVVALGDEVRPTG